MQFQKEMNQPIRQNNGMTSNHILSERVVEHEIVVPKRVVREEVIEKMIVVPETIVREEIVEEVQTVRETIVEIAKPVIHEKIVEVPEIEYRDKIVEVVEKVKQDKIVETPKIIYQDRYIEVPKIITQEKIVEVPNIEFQEEIIEKIVEVPEKVEQVVVKKVPVPQYVEYEIEPEVIKCKYPVPVESCTKYSYVMSGFKQRVKTIPYVLYAPRFIEVPVPAEIYSQNQLANMEQIHTGLASLTGREAPELSQVDELTNLIKSKNWEPKNLQSSPAWIRQMARPIPPVSIS